MLSATSLQVALTTAVLHAVKNIITFLCGRAELERHMLFISLCLFPSAFLAESLPEGRGFGDGKSQRADDLHMLGDIPWWYDWNLNPTNETAKVDNGAEFVAMTWGKEHRGIPLKKWLESWTPHVSTRHLLGFNEPNLRKQSNLTTSEVRLICYFVSPLLADVNITSAAS